MGAISPLTLEYTTLLIREPYLLRDASFSIKMGYNEYKVILCKQNHAIQELCGYDPTSTFDTLGKFVEAASKSS